MKLEEKIENRIKELIFEGDKLKIGNENDQIRNSEHAYKCKAWLTSVQNIIHLLISDLRNPYRTSIDNIYKQNREYTLHISVGEITKILQELLKDIREGLITSLENKTKALVFDNFLDHAKAYLKRGMKNEAGVIAGVVFEDTIRTICRNHKIKESDVNLDKLISELAKLNVITQSKAKRARAAAHVRTKATHAQWDEFDSKDVKATIELTEEIINGNLKSYTL